MRGAALLLPTLRWSDPEHLRPWVERGTPLTVFVPEHDEFLSPVQAVERFGTVPQAEVVVVVVVEGANHLLFGRAERILSELVTRLVPSCVEPLEPDPSRRPAAARRCGRARRWAGGRVARPRPMHGCPRR